MIGCRTATRLPAKSGYSLGHMPVWIVWPRNESRPSISGMFAADRQPVANTTNVAVIVSAPSVVTVHVLLASSKCALVTRVLKVMSLRRSYRSATWLA